MDYKYDAFISYNHNPRDIKITRSLQQKLEQYKIPEGIETRTGKKKIERVFLDKGELEVAGDLNEEILKALRNTDNLIVICSPEAKASPWVQKEIEYFLEFKDKSDILTVVTEGEPKDVLPEILTYREVTEEDGTIRREMAEPLSCDFRLPEKEANKVELPRLVAAIVGCRYDDLVQRRKQYRQKIITRITAGATALMTLASGYMVWSNHKLQVSYNNTLIEESKALILQSEEALADGNRIDAARFAVAALPTPEKKRPLVEGAAKALSGALNLYMPPGSHADSAVRQYKGTVEGEVVEGANVSKIQLINISGKRILAATYARGDVCFWDTETGEQLFTDLTDTISKEGNPVNTSVFCEGDYIVVGTEKNYICYDTAKQTEKWRTELGCDNSGLKNPAEIRNGNLWGVFYDVEEYKSIVAGVDLETGKVFCEYSEERGYPDNIAVSPDGKYALCSFKHFDDGYKVDHDNIVRVGHGADEHAKLGQLAEVTDIRVQDEDNVIIAGYSEVPEAATVTDRKTATWEASGVLRIFNSTEPMKCVVECMDPDNGDVKWSTPITGIFNYHPEISDEDDPEAIEDRIACTIGSELFYLDKNGKITKTADFGNTVAAYYELADDDWLNAILVDGSRCRCDLTDSSKTTYFSTFGAVVKCAVSDEKSVFVATAESVGNAMQSRIIEFRNGVPDAKWKYYNIPDPGKNIRLDIYSSLVFPYGENYVIAEYLYYNDGENSKGGNRGWNIVQCNSVTGELSESEILIESERYDDYKCVGFDEKSGMIYFMGESYESGDDETPFRVLFADVDTGEVNETKGSLDDDTYKYSNYDILDACVTSNDKPQILDVFFESGYYRESEKNCIRLLSVDVVTGVSKVIDLLETELPSSSVRDNIISIDQGRNSVWVVIDKVIHEFDIGSGEEKNTIELDYYPAGIASGVDGKLLILDYNDIYFDLHVYDIKKGKDIAKCNVGTMDIITNLDLSELPDGNIILYIEGRAAVVLNPTDWSFISSINDYKSFNPETGEICIVGETSLGHVPYRTLVDMIAEGIEMVGETYDN